MERTLEHDDDRWEMCICDRSSPEGAQLARGPYGFSRPFWWCFCCSLGPACCSLAPVCGMRRRQMRCVLAATGRLHACPLRTPLLLLRRVWGYRGEVPHLSRRYPAKDQDLPSRLLLN